MGFHLGTLHGYFFHKDFWPNLNFPLEYQIKLALIVKPFNRFSLLAKVYRWEFHILMISVFFSWSFLGYLGADYISHYSVICFAIPLLMIHI